MRMTETTTSQPACPECQENVALPQGLLVGELVPCSVCGTDLEVVATGPVLLAVAPEIEEDWGE